MIQCAGYMIIHFGVNSGTFSCNSAGEDDINLSDIEEVADDVLAPPLELEEQDSADANSVADDVFSQPSPSSISSYCMVSKLCTSPKSTVDVEGHKASPKEREVIEAAPSRKLPLLETPKPWKRGHRRAASAVAPVRPPAVQPSPRRRSSSLSSSLSDDSYSETAQAVVTVTPVIAQQDEMSPGEVMLAYVGGRAHGIVYVFLFRSYA